MLVDGMTDMLLTSVCIPRVSSTLDGEDVCDTLQGNDVLISEICLGTGGSDL